MLETKKPDLIYKEIFIYNHNDYKKLYRTIKI